MLSSSGLALGSRGDPPQNPGHDAPAGGLAQHDCLVLAVRESFAPNRWPGLPLFLHNEITSISNSF
jgi:hypothetical protein